MISILILFSATALMAQGPEDVRINEVLVKNVDNYIDGYGHRSSWIELHNAGYSKVDIADCHLRVVKNDGESTLYYIPKDDVNTVMEPQGYAIFFCEGTGSKGTFYTNFTLEDVARLEFLDPSGKGEPIHAIDIDYAAQKPDVSIGFILEESGKERFIQLPETTPNATNNTIPIMPRSEKFRELDPSGGMMAFIAIAVVMTVLAGLFLVFKYVGHWNVRVARKKMKAAEAESTVRTGETPKPDPHTGELVAAISLALYAYKQELHDRESNIITMQRVTRAYSPWSSKIYGLRQLPDKGSWKK